MNKEQSLALYDKGKTAWNDWAKAVREEREKPHEPIADLRAALETAFAASSAWIEQSRVDFSGHIFSKGANFSGFTFPGDASFHGAQFEQGASFNGVRFEGSADFGSAIFKSRAAFEEAEFDGDADFHYVKFSSFAVFSESIFNGQTFFSYTNFLNYADFEGAKFAGETWLQNSKFAGISNFQFVVFKENTYFLQCIFEGLTSFESAKFVKSANFSAITSSNAFTLADTEFLQLPDFDQAHFREPPRFDNVQVAPSFFWPPTPRRIKVFLAGDIGLAAHWRELNRSWPPTLARIRALLSRSPDPDDAARWRALKRLAIQGHDHARELEFFKGELKARRWIEDKPWHAVFWFGIFYQLLSDFGRSLLRPMFWWGLSVPVFANLYLGQHPALAKQGVSGFGWAAKRLTGLGGGAPPLSCVAGQGEAWLAALNLSFHKALLFLGLVPLNKLNQVYACLYGIYPTDGAQPGQLPPSYTPVIPDGVTAWGFVQQPLSAVLIFLFLLAVRNHFRIK